MGKKKPKDLGATPNNDAFSAQSDIFKTLFGDVNEKSAAFSIFSDDNPFRRKPPQERNEDGGSDKPDIIEEPQKRKRSNENEPGRSSDSDGGEGFESPSEAKRSKKEKLQNPKKLGGKNPNFGSESNGLGGDDEVVTRKVKEKKKRKRDELEVEYEARKNDNLEDREDGEKGFGGEVVGNKRKAVDNPADMLVSKEGFDDESKLLRTVFVGNLPLKIKKKALMKEFSKFGEVESVRIRSVPILDTKKPRKGAVLAKKLNDAADSVHAYIVFKTEQCAQASLSHNLAVVEGHHIRVDRACPPRKKLKGDNTTLYDDKRTVFVGNLPFDAKDEEVYQLFSGIKDLESSIEAFRVIRDPNSNVGKGFAYILFKTREAANLVVKKRNLKLRDRELRLYHSKQNSTPSKRRNPSSPAGKADSAALKRLAVDSRTPGGKKAEKSSAAMSYQGMRASKSGVQKKVAKSSGAEKFKSNIRKGEKERKDKRPAVAARKAKAKAMSDGGVSKQAGVKRKLDSRTPESSHRNKKVKKFR
ncbi:uncharacterized protein LOC107430535 [Ziziphus jujuba]|uniref:Uncharacterized protein LOC107430535 n=1 Tax=Ziziphus jujuba TaxID=326968 RepID=A0A6P6GLH7_ZIZJJ|nr:uncharacterized protein LOC107430535 [Ziziphus jujuba]